MSRDRVLLVGWFSFLHGEATAGDVLAWRTVCEALDGAGIAHDTAWSPVFRPGGLPLDAARPDRYSHVVFMCGPLHGAQVEELHRRFGRCRRIAIGVSVLDPADPAVAGFDVVIPRDTVGSRDATASSEMPADDDRFDLATGPAARQSGVPVVGVALASGQGEYGAARRHEHIAEAIGAWLRESRVAVVPVETRLDRGDWTLARRPDQLISIIRRLDAMITTRLHGLVLGLANAVPVLAVDPVAGGGKVGAQATVWRWPGLLPAEQARAPALERMLHWCLSPDGLDRARQCASRAARGGGRPDPGGVPALLAELDAAPAAPRAV